MFVCTLSHAHAMPPPPHINHDPCASSCLETLVTCPRVNAPVFTAGGESRVIRLWMWAWPDTAALRTGRGGGDRLAVPLRTHLIVGKLPLDFLSAASSLQTVSILVRIVTCIHAE